MLVELVEARTLPRLGPWFGELFEHQKRQLYEKCLKYTLNHIKQDGLYVTDTARSYNEGIAAPLSITIATSMGIASS